MNRYNLIVVGGGFAGSAAAIAAARRGLRVLLIEQGNALGGSAVNCLVNPYMGYRTTVDGKTKLLADGIFTEINDRLDVYGGTRNRAEISAEFLKIVLGEMAEESGVELLYHTTVVGAVKKENRLTSITVANKAGLTEYTADYFIDASGDADVAAFAGLPFRLGRPEDGLCQPMTLCFRVGHVDMDAYHAGYQKMQAIYAAEKAAGHLRNPRENVMIFETTEKDILHFNSTRVIELDPTDPYDLTKAEIEARKQVKELFLLFKEKVDGFQNATLLSTAASIGVRESRMIEGEYTLTADDIVACTKFEDAIALCNYEIDIHDPKGGGTSHYFFKAEEYYTIPYRTLIPKGMDNMLVAGRCISVDHSAQASMRIMPTVCCVGEAAGTAVALAAKSGGSVRDLEPDLLRKELIAAGAAV